MAGHRGARRLEVRGSSRSRAEQPRRQLGCVAGSRVVAQWGPARRPSPTTRDTVSSTYTPTRWRLADLLPAPGGPPLDEQLARLKDSLRALESARSQLTPSIVEGEFLRLLRTYEEAARLGAYGELFSDDTQTPLGARPERAPRPGAGQCAEPQPLLQAMGQRLAQVYNHRARDWDSEALTLRHYPQPIPVRNVVDDIADDVVDSLLEAARRNASSPRAGPPPGHRVCVGLASQFAQCSLIERSLAGQHLAVCRKPRYPRLYGRASGRRNSFRARRLGLGSEGFSPFPAPRL